LRTASEPNFVISFPYGLSLPSGVRYYVSGTPAVSSQG